MDLPGGANNALARCIGEKGSPWNKSVIIGTPKSSVIDNCCATVQRSCKKLLGKALVWLPIIWILEFLAPSIHIEE